MKMISYILLIAVFSCINPDTDQSPNFYNEISEMDMQVDDTMNNERPGEKIYANKNIDSRMDDSSGTKNSIKSKQIEAKKKDHTVKKSFQDSSIEFPVKSNKVEVEQDQPELITDNNDNISSTTHSDNEVVDFDHNHKKWNDIVNAYISNTGKVNYEAIKKNVGQLDGYLKDLEMENPFQNDWSKSEMMSFWINAYNAFTIKLIVDNYPLKSIINLEGGKVWDKVWINIGDKSYSLNDIEHNILRKKYNDARIHFAVNCAAKSCPPIWNKAWTPLNLESGLESRTKLFVNNTQFNSISKSNINISKIFEWYAVDFNNIQEYLNKYSNINIDTDATVTYKDYNWKLNN